jgi:hypothetical protein
MTKFLTGSTNSNFAPPRCQLHGSEQMTLHFYDRPGSPPGNAWVCRSCVEDRASQQTRWPNAGESGGAEL